MSDKKPNKSRDINHTYIYGYVLSLSLFFISIIVIFKSVSGNPTGYVMIGISLLIAAITSVRLPISKPNNWVILGFGILLSIFVIMMLLDQYDEAVNHYTDYAGEFSAGNGFLLDNIGQVAYAYAVPLFVIVSHVLFIINSRKKLKTLRGRKK